MANGTIVIFFLLFCSTAMAQVRTDQPGPLFGDNDGTNSGRYRSVKFTNGTTTNNGDGSISITTGGGGSPPGGSDTQIQYNNAGSFGGGNIYYISASGNVGIGSITPGEILDVIGTVRATSFIGDGSGLTGISGSGTVTSIATTSPITGGTITGTGTIAINNAAADGSTKGAASFTANDFDASSGNISIDYTNGQASSGSNKGFLTSSDWTTFNNKQASLSLAAGTYTNGSICSYASSGTLLNCNTTGSISGISLGSNLNALTATDTSLTFSGSYNGSTARTVGLNLGNANTWTGQQIFNTENVGIGSTAPGRQLDVIGTVRATSFIGDGSALTGISGSGTVTSVGLSSTNSTLTIGSTPVTTSGTITADLNLAHANTWTGQQIFNTANVGIGSTAPGRQLDVVGTVRATSFLGDGSGLTGITGGSSQFTTINTNDVYLPNSGNIGIGTSLTTTSALTVMNGNVGIGTWVPSENLSISGNSTYGTTTLSDATSITPNSHYKINYQSNSQAAGTFTVNADAGSPKNGQTMIIKINSTNVQTFSWNAQYVGGTVGLPTTTTGSSKIDNYSFLYDSVNSKWEYTGNAGGF